MNRGDRVVSTETIGMENPVPPGTPGVVVNLFPRLPYPFEVDFDCPEGRGWLVTSKEISLAPN